jgi:Bifunctional DNA primase/polymerase, N-terminal/Primase C terminal 1 (PriCT-1)
MSALRSAALGLASRELPVFPIVPKGKTPATAHGLLDATVDPAVIERWWAADPNHNVAIATGAPSGIFVVDVDGTDAEAKLRAIEIINGTLPSTVEAITARGRHIYLKMPPDTDIRNSASKIAPGVDVRATGGYVLAPPSIHPSGRKYTWSVDSANAIAEPPAWLLSLIASAAAPCATPPSVWHELVTAGVGEGARNDSVARLTGHLLRRYVDPQITLELIRTFNAVRCRPPLTDDEITAIVNSIAGKELKRRQEAGHG